MKAFPRMISGILAVAMILGLIACGGNSMSQDTSKVENTGKTDSVEPTKKVKMILWERKSPTEPDVRAKTYELREKTFKEKYPNYEIEYRSLATGTDFRQEYDKALMAGLGPTVASFLPYVDIPARIANHTVADITKFVADWDLKKSGKVWNAFDSAISTKDGKWFAVPISYYLSGLTYNKGTITAGGGDPNAIPKTWDEFTALGSQITDRSNSRYAYALMGMDWNAWEFTPWVWSAGGEMVVENSDDTYKIGFNENSGVDAAMLWHDMVWKYKMTQKNVLEDWNSFGENIKSGNCAFGWMTPMFWFPEAQQKFNQKPEDFGITPIPGKTADKAVTFTGGSVWVMNPDNDEEQMLAGWNYIQMVSYDEKYIMEEAKLKAENNDLEFGTVVRTDLIEKVNALAPWPDLWKIEMLQISKGNIKPEPYCPHWNDLKNTISKPLQKIILKENISREEVKAILDAAADELYKKYPDTFKK